MVAETQGTVVECVSVLCVCVAEVGACVCVCVKEGARVQRDDL